jgi:hypothetical protein
LHSWCRSSLSFSDSYLLQGVKKKEKRKVQRAILTFFTGSAWILAAHRGTTRLLVLPASICWAGGDRHGFRGNEMGSLPRISVRNGFIRATGNINGNSPLYTQRPSRQENLNESLLWLATFPAGITPLGSSLQQFHGVRPSYAPFTFPHCKQRSTLFERIEPIPIKRPRKGKTSIKTSVFFR